MPQVLPIKENLSNLLELASDGNCSLLFEEINQHLASKQVLKLIPGLSALRVASGPRMNLASCKSAFKWFIILTILR